MSFEGSKCFFHVDLDAFFASVEQLEHPEYRGKPVIVGGKPGDRRSVVSTASYEARKFGVHSAMPTAKAYELCPHGIYVHGNMKLYSEYSRRVMEIFSQYSPDVHQVSIDEAFLDMTGTQRLFGDPVDTARKLKAQVKAETGLTVSVGIATTNYIAKISSGLQKPDGLYTVFPGNEEKFMLSLPLEKVWGIGAKTQKRLRDAGFKSCRDIKDHSLQLLSNIFGPATAGFLYNVVRGIEPENFLSEPKSHSISIEKTYEYDLTDIPSIETAFLELSEALMFRMLRNKLTSRTISLKIRYEDFTTVNIQETYFQYITSVDDMFRRVMELFHKKYESGRGIRLLGIAANNTEEEGKDVQLDLFDFGEGKRQKVEKSILQMEQKNPDIKIHKARLLSIKPGDRKLAVALALSLLFSVLNPVKAAYAEEINRIDAESTGAMQKPDAAPPEKGFSSTTLFSRSFNENEIEFIANGFWKGGFKQTTTATWGFGNPFAISFGTPVFEQQVDISLWFMLNNTWYFEAAFADGFEKNTIAAGYKSDSYVREARVSNRKVVFPATYSVDEVNRGIGGGDNQAPGISGLFQDPYGKWNGAAAFRYDMISAREKTYFGYSALNERNIGKSDFMTGRYFVLPDQECIKDVTAVYVENYAGTFYDEEGRKYKKLSTSDYMILPARKLIILSEDAGARIRGGKAPAVAVEFSSSSTLTGLKNGKLGTFGTKINPGTGFLGRIQKAFGSRTVKDSGATSAVPNVTSYSYSGKSGTKSVPDRSGNSIAGFFSYIGRQEVLLLQHPAGFSPFSVSYRYDTGTSNAEDAAITHTSSGKPSTEYSADIGEDELAFTDDDFFSSVKLYADITNNNTDSTDITDPLVRYPFSDTSPGTYLGYGTGDDLSIKIRSLSSSKRFDIGTKAIEGTVQVYKNDILDSGASFNPESGEVTLSSYISSTDKIRILWYEDSPEQKNGAISAAAGFGYNFTPELYGDFSFASRWSVSPEIKYADENISSPGFATAATKIAYENDSFMISNVAAVTAENNNTTGIYRITGMDDQAPDTTYLQENAGTSLPDDLAPILNPRSDSVIAKDLDINACSSVKAGTGTKDREISGYKIPASWTFSGTKGNSEWAATAIKLASGSKLASASIFSIALKNESGKNPDVYLQLGVKADSSFKYENAGSIPTWKISLSGSGQNEKDVINAFDTSNPGWQTVSVSLTDEDRAFCTSDHDARLIIVNKGEEKSEGTISAGPYEIISRGMVTIQNNAFSINEGQNQISKSNVSEFSAGKNYEEKIQWKSEGNTVPDDTSITAYRYFSQSDLTPYSEMNMYFRYGLTDPAPVDMPQENIPGLVFVTDTDSVSPSGEGKIAAKAQISMQEMRKYADGLWHRLTIDLNSAEMKIDGTKLNGPVRVNKSVSPSRLKITVNTASGTKWHRTGYFAIDEFYLSDSSPHIIIDDKVRTAYRKDGIILQAGDFPIFSDFSISGGIEVSSRFETKYRQEDKTDFGMDSQIGFTAAGLDFSANIAREKTSAYDFSSAGHSVKTQSPLFNMISLSDSYDFSRDDRSVKKDSHAAMDFSAYGLPLFIKVETDAVSDEWSTRQKASDTISLKLNGSGTSCEINISGNVEQRSISRYSKDTAFSNDDYFQGYKDAGMYQFSCGDPNASRRNVKGEFSSQLFFPFSSISPKVIFSEEGKYSRGNSINYEDSTGFQFLLPFKINRNSFSLSWKKTSSALNETCKGGTYYSDIGHMGGAFMERDYFFKAPAFYDLFSGELADQVMNSTTASKSAQMKSYNGTYEALFSRQIYASAWDLLIPSGISVSFARDIKVTETVSDTYQAKTELRFSAFDIFGSNGTCPIATWFERDEYISSFIVTLKFPRPQPSDLKQVYTTYIQSNFYINEFKALKTGFQFEYSDQYNWQTKCSLAWRRTTDSSPVISIARVFKPDGDFSRIRITKTDSFNCTWNQYNPGTDESQTKKYQSYEYSHQAEAQVSRFVTLNANIDFGWSCTWDSICTAICTLGIGGKLQF